ncbi:M23 family metallopeptidase [Phenylobacterium sp.]|uniref:M23 family metallopeptidase n=1 Tax=Phenylobacterium sp. TaxID=1871053 RepID=UPI00273377E5|nr:M23 family metallopeptidase [Phenylobacterium sp.]MDP3854381.1 M23 family metallopeptidase [Phenylobacterium sp.]
MADPAMRAKAWLRNQWNGFVAADAGMRRTELAAQEEMRAQIVAKLDIPRLSLDERRAMVGAPRKDRPSEIPLRGPVDPRPKATPDPYFGARAEDFAGNETWAFPGGSYYEWNRKAPGQGDGRFGKGFRFKNGIPRRHDGVDITMPEGTPVYADRDGRVLYSGDVKDYGLMIDAGPDSAGKSRYAHLSQSFVKPGQQVKKGEVIGRSGRSGNLDAEAASHLHYERFMDGRLVDPYRLFRYGEASPNYRSKP